MTQFLVKRRGGVVLALLCLLCIGLVSAFVIAQIALASCNPETCENGCCGDTCMSSGQGCCNGTVYDTATQGCCNGSVYTLASEGCCGGVVYTLDTEGCCECCSGDTVYTYATEFCCPECGCVKSY